MSRDTPPPSGGITRTATGLIEQITESALDDDYYVFRGTQPRRTWRAGVIVGIVVALLALFVTMAAVQTRDDRPATELERRTLAADIESRQKTLDERRATAASLNAQVQAMRQSNDERGDRPAGLGVLAAAEAARGPGIVITADDSRDGADETDDGRITDRDLQILVNGLWYAGAEAVAVNENRIGSLSAIRTAADAITVNYRSISPPYTVVALGDTEALLTRFAQNPAGSYWEKRRESAGVKFDVTPSSDGSVPAVPAKRLELNHATNLEEGR
ncbi:DUF881 domain-containing protein [Aeromicrobium sp.]|uniref:DUF881 domain-containing protein n=1 Tax=Aeromicrobium sp. TaxID=1871063 RepID=UPI003D6A1F32